MTERVQFGEFTADLSSGELFRHGEKVRVQDLPFRVLTVLVTRPGEVVTREELRAALWGTETFVDAEAGLNTAIAKLREALNDRAGAPAYIETVPKRGYRFVGAAPAVSAPGASAAGMPAADASAPKRASVPSAMHPPASSDGPPALPSRWKYSAIAGALLVLVVAAAFVLQHRLNPPPKPTIAVVLFHNETGDAQNDRLAQQLTDATTVALAGVPDIAVIGNAAILRTPRIFADIKVIADALGADYVLIAQLQNPPEGLAVRLHFIRASDQKHVWAASVSGTAATLEKDVVSALLPEVRRAVAGR